MGNEMGNNNVSGIKEEEKAAVEVSEKAQETVPADEVRGENHVIPEAQSKDFHAKAEELSSNGLEAANDLDTERLESNEEALNQDTGGEDEKFADSSQAPEVSRDSTNSNGEESGIQKSASPDEDKNEQSLESILKNISTSDILQIHDQPSTKKETSAEETERSESTDSKTISQPSETSNQSTRSLEDSKSLLSNQSEEILKMRETSNLEEEKIQEGTQKEETVDDLVPEDSHIAKENCDTKTTENKIGDGLENHGDGQVPLISKSLHSSTEVALQSTPLHSPVATPEPQEKRIVHAEELDLISIISEKGENKQESNEIILSEQKVNELIINNSAAPVNLTDSPSEENGEQVLVLQKNFPNGEVKVTHKRSKSVLAANKRCQFEDTEEVIKILPTIPSVPDQLSSTDNVDKEEKTTSLTMNDECLSGLESFKWESSLLQKPNEQQQSSQNGFETQVIFADSATNIDPHNATTHASAISIPADSGTLAENEVISNGTNEQCPSGEMSHLPSGKAQESFAKQVESNPGRAGNQLQRSKSPSFDFGLQLDVKSEESDQTPLLHHDKTAARSFSGFANVRFQNKIIQTHFGRKSLDFEPVTVEEKTIRMERSDSDISRASFMNLLKKDEKGNAQFSPQVQERPVANRNSEDMSTEETALTSPKGSGKRKIRPSIFTSCICCTAAIH